MLEKVKKQLKVRDGLIPARLCIILAHAPSQVDISDAHKQTLGTSSQFREHKPREQITLGVHVKKRWWNENTTDAPSTHNQKHIDHH